MCILKIKLFIFLTNSLHVTHNIGIGCCGFRSTCIEYDINKISDKIDWSLKKMKQTKKTKQTEFAKTNEKLYKNCKIVKLYERKKRRHH